MLREFREFALRGSVMDMALGIIFGGVFTPITNSLVNDIFMPLISLLTGGRDIHNWFRVLRPAPDGTREFATLADAQAAGALTLNTGVFISKAVIFVCVCYVVFLMVRGINRWKKGDASATIATKECAMCCSEIPHRAKRCSACGSDLQPELAG